MSNLKPKIAFLGTGGTISYTGRNSLDVWEYMDFGTRLNISEILSRFPEVEEAADIVPMIGENRILTYFGLIHNNVLCIGEIDLLPYLEQF